MIVKEKPIKFRKLRIPRRGIPTNGKFNPKYFNREMRRIRKELSYE